MRTAGFLFLLLTASLGFPVVAVGYGRLGHEAIAEMARAHLNEASKRATAQVLGKDDFVAASAWADHLKQARKRRGPLAYEAEATEFNAKFPKNGQWHYMNLPLGTPEYKLGGPFSSEDDIVHRIEECVRILEAPLGKKAPYSRKTALRFLIHLVGDLHQPLHVGTGYFDVSGAAPVLLVDPDRARLHPHDEGGNHLRYSSSHFAALHELWDETLVERVGHTRNFEKLARVLEKRAKSAAWESTAGDYHTWPERWATDSVHEARAAYRGINFRSAALKRHRKVNLIYIELPGDYLETQNDRAANQLAKAGKHLAELLNAIRWP